MNAWGTEGFAEFYSAAHEGRTAFAWQKRLAEHVLSGGHWPEVIDAPTGAGKTAVIDVHVFAVAAMAAGHGARVPRRLSLVVDRRAVVDNHETYARDLQSKLDLSVAGVLKAVSDALAGMQSTDAQGPFGVSVLRGGASPARLWLDDPSGCQVICATPDMWGSRLLFRPFGGSRWAAPRAAGLLAYDSLLVVDEAHLIQQFTHTARTVRELLDTVPDAPHPVALQVVAMTATQPSDEGSRIGVEDSDLESPGDTRLRDRMTRSKDLKLLIVPGAAAAKARKGVAEEMAAEAVQLHKAHGGTVACVVNTVSMATLVASCLKKARGTEPAALVGRMRPYDVARLREDHPGLLTVEGDQGVEFFVATQTVEVGLDADFTSMVTELAPASALAQRVGRVNRVGDRPAGWVTVVVPPAEELPLGDRPPYSSRELNQAMAWLESLDGITGGLSPINLRRFRPPSTPPRRPALMAVEPWDGWNLANTSLDQFDEPDLELWLDDDLASELDVSVVVRQGLPELFSEVVPLLAATPALPHEEFRVPINKARFFLSERQHNDGPPRGAVKRGDAYFPLDSQVSIRTGDTLFISTDEAVFVHGVFDPTLGIDTETDVYESTFGSGRPEGRRVRIGRGFLELGRQVMRQLDERIREAEDSGVRDAEIIATLGEADLPQGAASELLEALLQRQKHLEVLLPLDGTNSWIVVANTERAHTDERIRQTWSKSGRVLLEDHGRAVAARAAQLADEVGLASGMRAAVVLAAERHDAGKSDPRFQIALGNHGYGPGQELAKSGMRSPARMRQAWAASGLHGWRHEQLSAALAEAELAGSPGDAWNRELVLRLVGTSHGRGRPAFDYVGARLAGPVQHPESVCAAVSRLFDEGGWEDLVQATHDHFGVWGCAYLEAIVRAADCQVSGEGR